MRDTWKQSPRLLLAWKERSVWRKDTFLQYQTLNSMKLSLPKEARVRGYIMRIISRRCWHAELYLELWYVVLNDRVWIKQRPSTAIDCQTLEISLIDSSQRALGFGAYSWESSSSIPPVPFPSLYNQRLFHQHFFLSILSTWGRKNSTSMICTCLLIIYTGKTTSILFGAEESDSILSISWRTLLSFLLKMKSKRFCTFFSFPVPSCK